MFSSDRIFQAHEDENRSVGRTDVQVEELCEIIGPECWHDDRLPAITKWWLASRVCMKAACG
jgi:hypothetical protein